MNAKKEEKGSNGWNLALVRPKKNLFCEALETATWKNTQTPDIQMLVTNAVGGISPQL